ncbi:MAG: VF530 family protein [Bacteroidetes bacterium]|nr:VF530 family protein [Bacteroidota bacterium]MBU1678080.1 VF530 family protein [Bacteroidota bacterium]MBU2507118.1 VF530 family protein [Bacteroidota bacterium]
MSDEQKNNPLHGITLEKILTQLVDFYGWEKLGRHININCFNSDPSIKSSLKFLRKTPWAREKVEGFYLHYGNPPWRKKESEE